MPLAAGQNLTPTTEQHVHNKAGRCDVATMSAGINVLPRRTQCAARGSRLRASEASHPRQETRGKNVTAGAVD
jgi:hypothetical protein